MEQISTCKIDKKEFEFDFATEEYCICKCKHSKILTQATIKQESGKRNEQNIRSTWHQTPKNKN